jgi:hypothetical protein
VPSILSLEIGFKLMRSFVVRVAGHHRFGSSKRKVTTVSERKQRMTFVVALGLILLLFVMSFGIASCAGSKGSEPSKSGGSGGGGDGDGGSRSGDGDNDASSLIIEGDFYTSPLYC